LNGHKNFLKYAENRVLRVIVDLEKYRKETRNHRIKNRRKILFEKEYFPSYYFSEKVIFEGGKQLSFFVCACIPSRIFHFPFKPKKKLIPNAIGSFSGISEKFAFVLLNQTLSLLTICPFQFFIFG